MAKMVIVKVVAWVWLTSIEQPQIWSAEMVMSPLSDTAHGKIHSMDFELAW